MAVWPGTASGRRSWPRRARPPRRPGRASASASTGSTTTSGPTAGCAPARPCPTPSWGAARGRRDPARGRWPARRAPGVLERGLLLRLRFELDLYVNLRPVKLYPGCRRRWPTSSRTTSTCWWCGRTPRACTWARAGPSTGAARPRPPPRPRSRPGPGSSGCCASPPRPASGPAGSPWSTRPTCWCTPATSGGRPRRWPTRPGSPSTTPTPTPPACTWSTTRDAST